MTEFVDGLYCAFRSYAFIAGMIIGIGVMLSALFGILYVAKYIITLIANNTGKGN